MTNNFLTADQIKAKNAQFDAMLAIARAVSQLAIGTKVRSKSLGYTGVIVEHLIPVMGIPAARIEYSARTLDTLEPIICSKGFTVDDLEVIE